MPLTGFTRRDSLETGSTRPNIARGSFVLGLAGVLLCTYCSVVKTRVPCPSLALTW